MCDNTASVHSDEAMLGAHRCGSLINSQLCIYNPFVFLVVVVNVD